MKVMHIRLSLCALLAAAAVPASAQFARAEDSVKYRQGAFYVMSQHFARIGAMLNGRAPYDARAATENAELVAALARLPATGFSKGTEHVSQKARAEIWTEQARFREQNDRMVAESARMLAAARANNVDQLKLAYAATAQTCKSCHDAYRNN